MGSASPTLLPISLFAGSRRRTPLVGRAAPTQTWLQRRVSWSQRTGGSGRWPHPMVESSAEPSSPQPRLYAFGYLPTRRLRLLSVSLWCEVKLQCGWFYPLFCCACWRLLACTLVALVARSNRQSGRLFFFLCSRLVRRLLFGVFTVRCTSIGRRERRVSKRKRLASGSHRWSALSFPCLGPCYDDPVALSARVNRTVPHPLF